MTKEEFLSLETGNFVRVNYDGIVADYKVENKNDEIVLVPDVDPVRIPKCDVEKWRIEAMEKRRGGASRPTRSTTL